MQRGSRGSGMVKLCNTQDIFLKQDTRGDDDGYAAGGMVSTRRRASTRGWSRSRTPPRFGGYGDSYGRGSKGSYDKGWGRGSYSDYNKGWDKGGGWWGGKGRDKSYTSWQGDQTSTRKGTSKGDSDRPRKGEEAPISSEVLDTELDAYFGKPAAVAKVAKAKSGGDLAMESKLDADLEKYMGGNDAQKSKTEGKDKPSEKVAGSEVAKAAGDALAAEADKDVEMKVVGKEEASRPGVAVAGEKTKSGESVGDGKEARSQRRSISESAKAVEEHAQASPTGHGGAEPGGQTNG